MSKIKTSMGLNPLNSSNLEQLALKELSSSRDEGGQNPPNLYGKITPIFTRKKPTNFLTILKPIVA